MSVFAEFVAPVTIYPIRRLLNEYPDVTIEAEAIVPTGGSMHHLWIRGAGHDELVCDLQSLSSVAQVEVVDELPDRRLVRFEWSTADPPVFELVESVDGRIVGAEGTADGWAIRARFPDQESLRAFYEESQDRAMNVELRQLFDPDSSLIDDGIGISPKQRETLELAFGAGYFDVPRQVTLQDLADELGISEQGVSERLRRGLSSFLSATLAEESAEHG